ALLLAERFALADLIEQSRLDTAEAEVQPRRPRPREGHRARVAAGRQLVDRRTPREGQAQDARAFVERLPRGIVARPADHRDLAVRLPSDKVAVAAGDDQPQHRRTKLVVLEQPRVDVGGKVANPDDRESTGPGDRLPQVDPYKQAGDQPRSTGDAHGVDLLPAGAGIF